MALNRTYFNALVDDDGTNLVGSVWNKAAVKNVILDPTDAELVIVNARIVVPTAPTTTGTQTALAVPTGTGDLVMFANNASLLTVQGIVAGTHGQRLTIVSKGAGRIDFAHNHASGVAGGHLWLIARSGLTSLSAGSGVASFVYDANIVMWRLVAHEQGEWLPYAYVSGDYRTGVGSGTWVVDAGDLQKYLYRLSGRTLTIRLQINSSTVTGSVQALRVSLPVGFIAHATNGGSAIGNGLYVAVQPGIGIAPNTNYIDFYPDYSTSGSWTVTTNATMILTDISNIEVQ